MGWEYTPESWRRKFKVGQRVWYLDHINHVIKKGTFVRYLPYEREYNDQVVINVGGLMGDKQIMESWTFTTESLANRYLKSFIKGKIASKEHELKTLKGLLPK